MRNISLFAVLLCLAACGVKGQLYRPSEPKPDPKAKKEQTILHPFPDQPPAEQEIMPDLI